MSIKKYNSSVFLHRYEFTGIFREARSSRAKAGAAYSQLVNTRRRYSTIGLPCSLRSLSKSCLNECHGIVVPLLAASLGWTTKTRLRVARTARA